MKKNRDSTELAARLSAAAKQPAGTSGVAAPELIPAAVTAADIPADDLPAVPPNPKKARPKEDTVPITLRPSSALLNKFVMRASDRTREEGRVVSAQQIMLEALERSV